MRSSYQIDFLPVETGSAAICLRYGMPGHYKLMVYDGGSAETGERMVAHIRERYRVNLVDDVVCSHPGTDQGAGLAVILKNMEVKQLWMHRPWMHSIRIGRFLERGARGGVGFAAYFKEKMAVSYTLERLAVERHVRVVEPFQSTRIGPFTVMSPHLDWYVYALLPEFENPPLARRSLTPEVEYLLRQSGVPLFNRAMPPFPESWGVETLQEEVATIAENESSVVLFGLIDGQGILLTGNAGVKALSATASFAESKRLLIPTRLKFVQVPSRGDASHVSPSVLDRLIGPKLTMPAAHPRLTAFVSTAADDGGYPSKRVVNALIRRGAQVAATKGQLRCYAYHYGGGDTWGPIETIPFSRGS